MPRKPTDQQSNIKPFDFESIFQSTPISRLTPLSSLNFMSGGLVLMNRFFPHMEDDEV